MEIEVRNEGKQLIDRWYAAQKDVEAKKSAVIKAECEASNAKNALGKWLCPDDARNGESFCIWYGDSLIQATKNQSDYKIEIRKRGKSLLV